MLNEAVLYFKKRPVFKKVFEAVYDRYYSLGRLGGTLVLEDLTEEERRDLSDFFYRDFKTSKAIKIRVNDIKKALESTRFESLKLKDIVEAYLDRPLVFRKEELEKAYLERKILLNNWLYDLEEGLGKGWLINEYQKETELYQFITRKYNEDKNLCRKSLITLSKQLDYLLDESFSGMNVAVFAAWTKADPHYLDKGNEGESWLTTALSLEKGTTYPANVEEYNTLYQAYGLDRDNLLNNSLVYGVSASHPAFNAYNQENEPHLVTLMTLEKLTELKANQKVVYVIENSSVFQAVIKQFKASEVTCICSRGQLNTTTLLLLDKLAPNVRKIYYSGDFDPEGLLIVQRLIERYPNKLEPWRLSVNDYLKTRPKLELSQVRLNKLAGVSDNRLVELVKKLSEHAKAGYQEMLIVDYIEDIKENLKK